MRGTVVQVWLAFETRQSGCKNQRNRVEKEWQQERSKREAYRTNVSLIAEWFPSGNRVRQAEVHERKPNALSSRLFGRVVTPKM